MNAKEAAARHEQKIFVCPRKAKRIPTSILNKAVFCIGKGVSARMNTRAMERENRPEVWTLNDDRSYADVSTLHWQIHPEGTDVPRRFLETADLEGDVEIMTLDKFPMQSIRIDFLNSTVDFMLAYADLLGFGRVYMYGCDYVGIKRELEMHSTRYWIGVLQGKGVDVVLSPMSRIFEGDVYGLKQYGGME